MLFFCWLVASQHSLNSNSFHFPYCLQWIIYGNTNAMLVTLSFCEWLTTDLPLAIPYHGCTESSWEAVGNVSNWWDAASHLKSMGGGGAILGCLLSLQRVWGSRQTRFWLNLHFTAILVVYRTVSCSVSLYFIFSLKNSQISRLFSAASFTHLQFERELRIKDYCTSYSGETAKSFHIASVWGTIDTMRIQSLHG